MSDENRDDDAYVLEDDGSSIEQIEREMNEAAKAAADEAPAQTDSAAAAVEQDLREFKDRYLRTLADFENFRKRSEREKQDYFKYAMAGVIKDLLPVLDNFDRALEHAEEGDDFHKGVSLIYKQLFDVLRRHGLRVVEESGVRFDPNIHEGVVTEENATVPHHTVVAVLQKGYFLHDRLLRPAMVKVAVGGPEE
ncbi:MAG TPA: nucleotide exchange factor GrpE [Thermoanaerobaculia bacterium]|nr:nucleotide exchange factor GrpE [Thermoanaerobaculia bacterium]